MADWQSYEIQVPGKDVLEPVRGVLETLMVYLDVLKAILDTIKVFLVDFGNPIRALVEVLIALIEELFASLKVSGFYAYFDVPNPMVDPNFNRHSGGFPAFTQRFKASLFDERDFSRPQPRTGSTQSGFVLLVVDASSPFALLHRVQQLLRFFSKEFTAPRYEGPGNFKAIPVGASGDPILAVASIFKGDPVKAIQLRWSLPSSLETPDPGFTDVVVRTAKEFVPPKFLIERSTVNPAFGKIQLSQLGDPQVSGQVEFDRETSFVGGVGSLVTRKETLVDNYGDPVIKFQKYISISPSDITSLVGQLGTFRYIDTDVEPDKIYYYRVRAYSGDLRVEDHQIPFPTSVEALQFTPEYRMGVMLWPPMSSDEVVVMGKPSGIVSAIVPVETSLGTFDVVEVLKRVYLTAFSLDFHLPMAEDSRFDRMGLPIDGTPAGEVGRGSLSAVASPLGIFQSFPIVGILARKASLREGFSPDDITGKLPELPWQKFLVHYHAIRLANIAASALLQAGSRSLSDFRSIMTGNLPMAGIPTKGSIAGVSTLEDLVFKFTGGEESIATIQEARAYVDGYMDPIFRINVLEVVKFLNNFAGVGVPPDWIAVSPLRDIIPWSGEIIYEILDKVRALLDAFKGVTDEINAFIALLERKIEALERFLQFLLNILSFIESLQMGAYVLSAQGLTGDSHDWVEVIDRAGGAKPPTGPGGYSAGVGLAYVVTDARAFKDALSIIFGN